MHPSMDVDATYAVPHPPPGQTSAQANSSSHVRTHLQVLIPNPRSYSPSSSLSSSFLGTPNDSPRASKQRTPRSLSEAHSSCDEQQTPDPLNSSRKLRRKAQQQQQSSNTSRQSHHSIMEALAPMSPGDVMLVPKPPSLSTARGPDSGRALRVDTTTGSGTQPSSAQLPPVTVGGPTTPTSTLWRKLGTSVTPSETSSRRLFPLNGSNLGPPPPVNNTATVSTAFCADSQIGRLLNWLLRCSARLGDVVGGISEASAENIKLENLANFGRRHSCASIPINTPRHGVSLEPLTPQASRRGSRSSSVNSDGNHSRSSSIGSGTERERPSSSARAPPSLRQHSSSRSSFQSNGSLPPITRCTQDRSQDISTQALVLMKEQMEQVHHQLLDEIRFLASRSFLLMTDDATQRFLELFIVGQSAAITETTQQ
ncbi:Hypothetical protein, putative [Bodo saltans]|uniref:Uncharacterized protein n=1 Tax=Bodo saltans TaxID=75058 RepID=A0A0S4JT31_BODSA|nr:Hypothetical protein, putative [Bodo saltans]|eukprot:CUG93974.1 Hypothetical protein, putative [Bodo saltans]